MSGIVILGGGECGSRAAFSARDQGYSGPITIVDEETGLPYERPPLSKPDAQGIIRKPICSADMLRDKAITLLDGLQAISLDREVRCVTLSTGVKLGYDKLLFATGASARQLTCDGGERALSLRTVHDAARIYDIAQPGTKVVIVGAGLIGLELAAVLVARGVDVSVLEYAPVALGRNVPRPLAQRIVDRHVSEGSHIFCGVEVDSITAGHVVLADGRMLAANLVVAAIGVAPRTGLAAVAGLAIENGVCVNDNLCTDDPHVFAAGDCASVQRGGIRQRFETWQNAQIQGDIAGRNMAGGQHAFDGPVWFWSDQFDLGLQGVGQTNGAVFATRKVDNDAEVLFYVNEASQLVGAVGLGRGNAIAKDIKLAQKLIEAGVSIVAEHLNDPDINLKTLLKPATTA
ncbi:NAD(P)/FAD-dependent oxidoreductase [Yoonia vestfoldensis]|nr:FAD-dependent oxidoreductase [Yoonia vestfoldensis]